MVQELHQRPRDQRAVTSPEAEKDDAAGPGVRCVYELPEVPVLRQEDPLISQCQRQDGGVVRSRRDVRNRCDVVARRTQRSDDREVAALVGKEPQGQRFVRRRRPTRTVSSWDTVSAA